MRNLLCGLALWPALAAAQDVPTVPPPAAPDWEAALGAIVSYQPEYIGAASHAWGIRPAFMLRWGRIAISNGGGMVTRRHQDVAQGLSYAIVDDTRWRANIGLRVDQGRSDNDSQALQGLGGIGATVRARLYVRRQLTPEWNVGASWNPDILGRRGGAFGELGLGWERERAWWDGAPPLRLGVGASIAFANPLYMRRQFGVDEAQAAASGYPVYRPGSGLTGVHAGIGLRGEFTDNWGMQLGLDVSRLLGPAAASPLTQQPLGWGVNAGVMRRF